MRDLFVEPSQEARGKMTTVIRALENIEMQYDQLVGELPQAIVGDDRGAAALGFTSSLSRQRLANGKCGLTVSLNLAGAHWEAMAVVDQPATVLMAINACGSVIGEYREAAQFFEKATVFPVPVELKFERTEAEGVTTFVAFFGRSTMSRKVEVGETEARCKLGLMTDFFFSLTGT